MHGACVQTCFTFICRFQVPLACRHISRTEVHTEFLSTVRLVASSVYAGATYGFITDVTLTLQRFWSSRQIRYKSVRVLSYYWREIKPLKTAWMLVRIRFRECMYDMSSYFCVFFRYFSLIFRPNNLSIYLKKDLGSISNIMTLASIRFYIKKEKLLSEIS
jgi:hypothetical protein